MDKDVFSKNGQPILPKDPLWYKDAIIYELHIKSFCDSNGDGIGDIPGLIGRLDYLQDLGVTAIWVLPFYPSPLEDDGYDIADYCDVHPQYGTLHDFRELLKQAHKRQIRVITELVLNHTSQQHPWFQKARHAKPDSRARNFYVWSDTPEKHKEARIIFKDFESSNWTWDPIAKAYYWHRFYSHQPDLNFESQDVQKALFDVIDFWLEMGVDGLRLDAIPYLFERDETNCENLPETHAFLKQLRGHVDKKFQDRMLLAEANQWPEDAAAYFGKGDECHMAFNFPVMPRMFMSIQMEDSFPITDIFNPPAPIPEICQWAIFLRNHDELTLEMVTDEERDYMYRVFAADARAKINLGIRRRLAPLLGNNRRKIELMNILLLSLIGTPVLYYGDEIGMGDNYYLGDRDGVRTPMQWSPQRNAGFSQANPQKLCLPVIIDPEYHYESVNVETQEGNLSSFLWWTKRVIAIRKKFKAFGRGDISFAASNNTKVLAFTRTYEDQTVLVIANLSRFSQSLEVDLTRYAGLVPEEAFSQNEFPPIRETPYVFTLGPYDHFWLLLRKPKTGEATAAEGAAPSLNVISDSGDILKGDLRKQFEQKAIPLYLNRCKWFIGKERFIRKVTIVEDIPVMAGATRAYLLIVLVHYKEGMPESYLIPVAFAAKEQQKLVASEFPQAIIAYVKKDGEEGMAYDGCYCAPLREALLDIIDKRKRLKGSGGILAGIRGEHYKKVMPDSKRPAVSSVIKSENNNTSLVYDTACIMKIFRRLEGGVHPDVEMLEFLTDTAGFSCAPAYAGSLQYIRAGSEPMCAGLLQQFVQNQGDAWSFVLKNVHGYFEKILSSRPDVRRASFPQLFGASQEAEEARSFFKGLTGEFFSEMVAVLGKRTGMLHEGLASGEREKEFCPEPFSILYQRSVYQSMASLLHHTFDLLRRNAAKFPDPLRSQISELISFQPAMAECFKRLTAKKFSCMKIRIHGDYHLGQILFTGKDFAIIDLEGESARSLGERRVKRSALRDVAGMMRSFHYAAFAGLLKNPSVRPEDITVLEPWAKAWRLYVNDIFVRSYLDTVGKASFLPSDQEDFSVLLEALLLEKALFEIKRELIYRPEWLSIAMRGIRYIVAPNGLKPIRAEDAKK